MHFKPFLAAALLQFYNTFAKEGISLLQVRSTLLPAGETGIVGSELVGLLGTSAEASWRHAVSITAKEITDELEAEALALAGVPTRMQYWSRWADWKLPDALSRETLLRETSSLPRGQHKYLLFDPDIGGLNNIRMGWEAAGILANLSGRTLVLPPASPFYLIDWGPPWFTTPVGMPTGRRSKVEDYISLPQLRRHTRALTFKQFLREMRQSDPGSMPAWLDNVPERDSQEQVYWWNDWQNFSDTTFKAVNTSACEPHMYQTDDIVLHSRIGKNDEMVTEDGRLFTCMMQDTVMKRRDFEHRSAVVPAEATSSWQLSGTSALLQHGGFVWHPEVFQLAAPIVADLGMFAYASLHARYGDLQYDDMKQLPSLIVDRWFASEEGRRLTKNATVVYVATDGDESVIAAFRERGITAKWGKDYFEAPDSPIAELLGSMDPYRVHQLMGPVEQVVCAFGRFFVGTGKSTFTDYINDLRFNADAPITTSFYHTHDLNSAAIAVAEEEMTAWEQRRGGDVSGPAPSLEKSAAHSWRAIQELDDPDTSYLSLLLKRVQR